MKFFINRLLLMTCLTCMTISTIYGQLKVNTYSYSVEDGTIPDGTRDQIELATVALMQRYYQSADFIDDASGMVTSTSAREFKALFEPKARVLNDLTAGVNSHYEDYANNILNFLQKGGIKFDMKYSIILEMEYDEPNDQYNVVVQAEKTVYTGLNYNNEPEYCKKGREYLLEFHVVVAKDLETAQFSKIKGTIRRRCEDARPFVGAGLRGAADLLNNSTYQATPFLENQMNGLVYTPATTWSAGLGVNYQLPILKSGLLYLNVGLNYTMFGQSGTIEGDYVKENDNIVNAVVEGGGYNPSSPLRLSKMVDIEGGQEDIIIHTVEVPVGIRYRQTFKEMEKIAIVADLFVVPTYHIGSKVNLSAEKVSYSAVLETNPITNNPQDEDELFLSFSDSDLDILGFGTDNTGTIENTPELAKQLSFSLRIAPGVQYILTPNILLEASIDYTLGLTTFYNDENLATIGKEGGNNYFLEDVQDSLTNLGNDLNRSFIEHYIQETKINSLGIRIGALYLLK